jgi:demethylspheroidene O-methyltransferase
MFDLPPVAARAKAKLAEAGVTRAQCVGGDFFSDALPRGADLMTLVRVIHDHDDHKVLALLKSARSALPDDGTLLIAEPMAGVRGSEAVGAYFAFYLMAMGQGRPRTASEIGELLAEAGFRRVRSVKNNRPALVNVIAAQP